MPLTSRWTRTLVAFLVVLVIAALTRSGWSRALGESLVCLEKIAPSDALFVDNLDPDYLVFERTTSLYTAGVAPRIIVTVPANSGGEVKAVSKGIAEVMAGIAHLPTMELLAVQETEPITLNAARQVRAYLVSQHLKSLIVVTSGFRSARSADVFRAVLEPAGISVSCVPVFGLKTTRNWSESMHGIQEVGLQTLKFVYYRLFVRVG